MNVDKAQSHQKRLFHRGTCPHTLSFGEQVLVLLPNPQRLLKLEWIGPFKVMWRVSPVDYEVKMPGRCRERRGYHVNLMKSWNPPTAVLNLINLPDLK